MGNKILFKIRKYSNREVDFDLKPEKHYISHKL